MSNTMFFIVGFLTAGFTFCIISMLVNEIQLRELIMDQDMLLRKLLEDRSHWPVKRPTAPNDTDLSFKHE